MKCSYQLFILILIVNLEKPLVRYVNTAFVKLSKDARSFVEIDPHLGKHYIRKKLSNGDDFQYNDTVMLISKSETYNYKPMKKYYIKVKRELNSKNPLNSDEFNLISQSTVSRTKNNYDDNLAKDKSVDKILDLPSSSYDYEQQSYHGRQLSPIMTELDTDYAISKSKADMNSEVFSSTLDPLINYEYLRSLMYYHPADGKFDYTHLLNNFHIDDNDIRTSRSINYETLPFLLPSEIDYKIQKSKDKRFVAHSQDIKPVYEDHNHYEQITPVITDESTTADNPISGHSPFFSFTLKDYYDKGGPDGGEGGDFLIFNDNMENSYDDKNFDSYPVRTLDQALHDRRTHKLLSNYPSSSDHSEEHYNDNVDKSVTEKSYMNHYDQFQNGGDLNAQSYDTSQLKDSNFKGFKDFLDSFSNNVGAQEHKRDSHYAMKMDKNAGEKRKGYHRIYHKDEYKEDKEFYDNNHVQAEGNENGLSSVNKKAIEGVLNSHAAAALGNAANSHHRGSSVKKHAYGKNRQGLGSHNVHRDNFVRYSGAANGKGSFNNGDYGGSILN